MWRKIGLILMLFLGGCFNDEASLGKAPAPIIQQELKELVGIVEEATMNTLVVQNENGDLYGFDTEDIEIKSENTGIVIGNPVTVYYHGFLDDDSLNQNVELVSIDVQDVEVDFIAEYIDQMTLEEKVGQLFFVRCPLENANEKLSQYHLGGYLLFVDNFKDKAKEVVIEEIVTYQNLSKIPLLVGVDEEGGLVNRVSLYFREYPFASPQELFLNGGYELIEDDVVDKSNFLHEFGINVNFAPVADISMNPYDYMYSRSFGQDASATAEYVRIVVEMMDDMKMGSVLKHFPGYGNNVDTHTGIAIDSRDYASFVNEDFLPFQAGIYAGADMVLVSHNIVQSMDSESPASLSAEVHRILRKELHFDGVIITDDLYMKGVRQFASDEEVAVLAILAGNDMLCCTDFEVQIPAVIEAVEQGVICEERIDESLVRILQLKNELGLL